MDISNKYCSKIAKKVIFIALLSVITHTTSASIIIDSFQNFKSNLKEPNTEYIIKNAIDLNGHKLKIPENCILQFEDNAYCLNGTIVGNNTKVISDKHCIFNNIKLLGTWNNRVVYSQWVGLSEYRESNNQELANLMTLCNSETFTDCYLQKGCYFVSAIKDSAPIVVPGNTYLHNKATIKMQATDLGKYNMVLLNKVDNVTIDGGTFIGDVIEHFGSEGEWGHGIKCGGATNVILKNLTCKNFWGDGIDIIEGRDDNKKPTILCNNITINNVKCLFNRRQGISIEAANNVFIYKSEFAFTGKIAKTAPAGGLVIEPWGEVGDKLRNIYVSKSEFHDNEGYDIKSEPNWKYGKEYKTILNEIYFNRCSVGRMKFSYSYGVTMSNSVINDMLIYTSDRLMFKKCKIKKTEKSKEGNEISYVRCKMHK